MSVLEMKYISIVGPLKEFDNIVIKYIVDNNIQLEHSISTLEDVKGRFPFIDENPYEYQYKRLQGINDYMKVYTDGYNRDELIQMIENKVDMEEVNSFIKGIEDKSDEHRRRIQRYYQEIEEREQIKKQLNPILDLNVDIHHLFHLDFIKFRFGKLSRENYRKLNMYILNLDVIVVPVHFENDEVWLSYFMPVTFAEKIDNIFSSLYFERVRISGKIEGSPQEALNKMNNEIADLRNQIRKEEELFQEYLKSQRVLFADWFLRISFLYKAFSVRKYASHTMEAFYITGWIPKKDLGRLSDSLKTERGVTHIVEDPDMVKGFRPPTKLENNRFFKPFETIVTMYGLPSHNEIDPTVIIALSYILMFGAMFGDLGQGFIIVLAGIVLARKGKEYGTILASIGISSMIFGFIYGSVFGSEEIIHTPILSPMHNINTLLYMAIGFGVFMIVLALILNIINLIRSRQYGKLFFDKNGIAGFVFYMGFIITALYFIIEGKMISSLILISMFFIIPLILILLKEPLENLIHKRDRIFPEDVGGYFVEGFFELFETILGFLSNTISFVRVGAFALNHAGLSLAVWTLYRMSSGAGSILVVIIGNILIIGLEGLIVGIQCLRLQYYEMFSRFFQGEGRNFTPLNIRE